MKFNFVSAPLTSPWYIYLIIILASVIISVLVILCLIRFVMKRQEKGKDYGALAYLLTGKPNLVNPNRNLKDQVALIPYNTDREIPRTSFDVGDQIGSGNFGSVHRGTIKELFGTNSKPDVAIKCISGHVGQSETDNFLYEIKIMSYVDPHINLVSMIGACTGELAKTKEMWLVLEFCEYGDLKSYLIGNSHKILNGNEKDRLNSRCLLIWIHGIAKGMQYLAENQIMHGDLAARNILLDKNPFKNGCPVAKVADFGLSKKMYDNMNYEKKERTVIPWKWMALELLTSDYLTMRSDVWSFGVLLWETFSFGKAPYGQVGYDELVPRLENGYRLPCPSEIISITSWSPAELYFVLAAVCFKEDPELRASFVEVVEIIEKELRENERNQYAELSEIYDNTNAKDYLKIGKK